MDLIKFFFKTFGIRNRPLFYAYFATFLLITGVGLSLPASPRFDPVSFTAAVDGIEIAVFIAANGNTKN